MSRGADAPTWTSCGFPRVSGDEPRSDLTGLATKAFSPRERG